MIVIPMAGESSRFRRAGYDLPKYMLEIDERPLFDWTVLSFKHLFDKEHFLFVARDVDGTALFLKERLKLMGLDRAEVVYLDAPTRGQAETVRLGIEKSKNFGSGPLTIFNIDTIRPGFRMPKIEEASEAAGWLEVFRGPGDAWSFVKPDPNNLGRVLQTSEKVRISDLCCTGMYGFASIGQFLEALDREALSQTSSELFVAPLYNHVLSDTRDVFYYEVDASEVLFSGVPAEYEDLKMHPERLEGLLS